MNEPDGVRRSRAGPLPALTSLRFAAAILVVAYHYRTAFESPPIFVEHGDLGVSFFFVLSGFILSHAYAGAGLERGSTRRRFALARLARIYPAYLFAFAFALPLVLDRGFGQGFTAADLAAFVLGPLMLQAWVPGLGCVVNCPGWSISVEIFFYAAFPLLLGPVQRRPWAWMAIALGLWAALTGIAWRLLAALPPGQAQAPLELQQLIGYLPLMRLPEFLAGMVLHAWVGRREPPLPWAWLLVAIGAGFLLLSAGAMTLPRLLLNNGFSALLWIPLILAGAQLRGGWLCSGAMVFLGQISYGLYLLHVPIAAYADFMDRRVLGGGLGTQPWALPLLAFGLSLGAAAALHLFIEEPLRRRICARGLPAREPALARAA